MFYPLLPMIFQVASGIGVRRAADGDINDRLPAGNHRQPMMSATTAAMISLFAEKGMTEWGLPQILMVSQAAATSPASCWRLSLMLRQGPEGRSGVHGAARRRRDPRAAGWSDSKPLKPGARLSAFIFLTGVVLVALFDFFPGLRQLHDAKSPLAMPIVIEILMMSVAAIMLVLTRVPVDDVPKTTTLRAGVVAVIGIFGLAWLGDSFIAANKDVIVPAIGDWAKVAPWTFAFGLFLASVLLYSQARHHPRADAAGHGAGHPAAVPDCDVSVGQRLLLHPDLRLTDRGHQLRPVGHHEDRQIRAEPLVCDPGAGRHVGVGVHRTCDRAHDLLMKGRPGVGGNGQCFLWQSQQYMTVASWGGAAFNKKPLRAELQEASDRSEPFRRAVYGLRILATALLLGISACGPSSPPPLPGAAPAVDPEHRHFTGTWSVSGTRQTLDMGPGHRVEAFRLGGSLMLTGEQRLGLGFRSDVIGLADNQTGMQGRSVWTDERGDQVFSELSSATTGPGNLIQGRIVGGTGRFAGVSGDYSFNWHPLVVSEDGGVSGRVIDLKGSARLASPQARRRRREPGKRRRSEPMSAADSRPTRCCPS